MSNVIEINPGYKNRFLEFDLLGLPVRLMKVNGLIKIVFGPLK